MLLPWTKRQGVQGSVLMLGSGLMLGWLLMLAPEGMAQYGAMPYYGADAGVTYGTPVGQRTGGQMGYPQRPAGHLQSSVPRSPGAGIPLVNGGARYWGVGYSEGYHSCGSCACGACGLYGAGNTKLGNLFSGGLGHAQMKGSVPNIVAPGAPACQSCPTPIQNSPCGNVHFGNYNLHPGHVFGKPSYGNPLFAPDCINWRQAVQYDQGPCIPGSVYANHPLIPPTVHSGGHYGLTNGPVGSNAQPALQQSSEVSHNPPQPSVPRPLTDSSPSDLRTGDWPWQRGQGNAQQIPGSPPGKLPEPTPANPDLSTPVPATPVPATPDLSTPDLSTPVPATPQVPAPPAQPAPKTEPTPAADDEDLLSNRRNPIRQPTRR